MATKLSKVQQRVMVCLDGGYSARNTRGEIVEINGKKVCTTVTMAALVKMGLVEYTKDGTWKAKPSKFK